MGPAQSGRVPGACSDVLFHTEPLHRKRAMRRLDAAAKHFYLICTGAHLAELQRCGGLKATAL